MVLVATVFAAIFGSFANMLIYRLPRQLDTVRKRSFCPHCNHVLGVKDLVPLLSFISTLGRCRYCHQRIAPQYFLVELFLTLSAALLYQIYGLSLFALVGWVLLFVGIILIYIDMEFQLLPDVLTLGFMVFAIAIAATQGYFLHSFLTALGAGFFLYLLTAVATWFLKQEAMGGGDIKWAAAMGAVLGFPKVMVGLFMGFMLGAAMALVAMFVFKKGRRDAIPFGPALILGTWIAYFGGGSIWSWYWRG